jgi:hypothetical protein
MTLVGILVALLHALTIAAPSPPGGSTAVAHHVSETHVVRSERIASRRTSDTPEQVLRASRAIAAATIQRASRAAPLRDGSSLAPQRAAPGMVAATAVRPALGRGGDVGHAVASRGSLLAYFPTAPPLLG